MILRPRPVLRPSSLLSTLLLGLKKVIAVLFRKQSGYFFRGGQEGGRGLIKGGAIVFPLLAPLVTPLPVTRPVGQPNRFRLTRPASISDLKCSDRSVALVPPQNSES